MYLLTIEWRKNKNNEFFVEKWYWNDDRNQYLIGDCCGITRQDISDPSCVFKHTSYLIKDTINIQINSNDFISFSDPSLTTKEIKTYQFKGVKIYNIFYYLFVSIYNHDKYKLRSIYRSITSKDLCLMILAGDQIKDLPILERFFKIEYQSPVLWNRQYQEQSIVDHHLLFLVLRKK